MTGTGAIKIQSPPSKPKREITKNTNSQNTLKTYCQPSGQHFPKMRPLRNDPKSRPYNQSGK